MGMGYGYVVGIPVCTVGSMNINGHEFKAGLVAITMGFLFLSCLGTHRRLVKKWIKHSSILGVLTSKTQKRV